jgi:WD40 repeat protein
MRDKQEYAGEKVIMEPGEDELSDLLATDLRGYFELLVLRYASQETGPADREENTLAAPTPAAILKRLRLGRPSLLPEMDGTQLLAALESNEWQVRVSAVQKLEEWGERAPIERLIKALKDEHEAVRAAAAHALGAHGNPKAIAPLVDALQDMIWLVRAAAVQALGMLGEPVPVEPLMLALQDEDESVRAVAVRALGTMGEGVPIERLLVALQDSAWQVREMAVLALGARGGHIPRATLMAALQDEDESVRRAAHFLQEMYPDRFAETAAGFPASVSEESTGTILDTQVGTFRQAARGAGQQEGKQEEQSNDLLPLDDERGLQHATQHRGIRRYPRRGTLHVLRLVLLACWSIFLGYLVSVIWNLVQLTHADPAQLTTRVAVQTLSAPLIALAGLNVPVWVRGVCVLFALLLFFGCLWAARDTWKEYKWKHSQGVGGEELEVGSGDHDQFARAPINPPLQTSGAHLLSRRAVLVGLTTALIVGNSIAWSLLLNRKRRPQGSPGPALGTVLYIYRRHTGYVSSVAWSPDSIRIASGSFDKTVQVWDAANGGHRFVYHRHTDEVWAVAWSPDGRRIASGSADGTVRVWEATTGRNIFTYRGHIGNGHVVTAVAWSPDGRRIASGSNDGTVQVWDAVNGGHSFVYRGHTYYVVSTVAWSPDGRRIASGDVNGDVQVWDAANGGHVYKYLGHLNASGRSAEVWAVAWSPDGRRIASGSADRTVQVWDAFNGGHRFIYRGHTNWVVTVAWSPDGAHIASGSVDKTVQVWDAG